MDIKKFFNIAGPCDPEIHYMLPAVARLPDLAPLFERRAYFVLHAPRQTGKTTSLAALTEQLTAEGRYAALHMSCESAQAAEGDLAAGVDMMISEIAEQARQLPEDLRPVLSEEIRGTTPGLRLRVYLARWAERAPRPLVLFFDEIDSLRGKVLISVLRQLRTGYPDRPRRFPQSIALAGLRDVRDYKLDDLEGLVLGSSSPFNIKTESFVLPNFSTEDVMALYTQHTEATDQAFTDDAVTRVYELSRGQPWLVNAMAWHLVEKHDGTVTAENVDEAAEQIIERRDTHLDSLLRELREDRVRRVIAPLLAGDLVLGDRLDDDLSYVEDLGLISRDEGHLKIANPIYHEIVPRVLASSTQYSIPYETEWYLLEEGRLDMDALLDGFVDFWREHGEAMMRSQPYREIAFQLVVMSFLQRIINGGGRIDREYAVGRGRLDLCVCWPYGKSSLQREVLELKVWRDGRGDPLKRGLSQLDGYLASLDLDHGALLIFDQRANAGKLEERSSSEEMEYQGRRIRLLRL